MANDLGFGDNISDTINTPGLSEEKKLAGLRREFGQVLAESAQYILRIFDMDDARFCRWMGQSADGRKWSENTGKGVFPWEGSADSRVWYIDDVINDDVDVMMSALKRGRMQTKPTNMTDSAIASATNVVLDYVLRNEMQLEWDREMELAANWRQHIGSSVIQTDWLFSTGTEQRTITIQDIFSLAQQDPELEGMLRYIAVNHGQGLSQDDIKNAAQKLQSVFPDIQNPMEALQSLEVTGSYIYDAPYLKESRPTIMALATARDVFYPMNTYDLQKARWIVRRDIMDISTLEETAALERWNPEFLEKMKHLKGMSAIINYINTNKSILRRNKDFWIDEFREMYEVFYCYSDEWVNGARKVMVTVFHPNFDVVGARELSPYLHGKKPFTVFQREKAVRAIIESRGVADIAQPAQEEIKVQRDFRTDRTSFSIIPPLVKPATRAKTAFKLGPACEVTEVRPGEIRFMEIPQMSQDTILVEQATRSEMDSYFGKANAQLVDPNKVLRKQQRLTDAWLSEVREVVTQVGQLCQQYMEPQDWQRIANIQNIQLPLMDREQIQKEFHLTFEFDARDLNMEYAKQKLEMVETLANFDRGGTIDYDYFIRWGMITVDPTFADHGLKPPQSVTQKEIDDEQNAVAKISLGIDPPLLSGSGVNYQLRLSVIQDLIRQSPILQKLILGDQMNSKLLENRMKGFQFQIEQQQNSQIGRLGTKQVLNGPQPNS